MYIWRAGGGVAGETEGLSILNLNKDLFRSPPAPPPKKKNNFETGLGG